MEEIDQKWVLTFFVEYFAKYYIIIYHVFNIILP